jgi:hypothetical protein
MVMAGSTLLSRTPFAIQRFDGAEEHPAGCQRQVDDKSESKTPTRK